MSKVLKFRRNANIYDFAEKSGLILICEWNTVLSKWEASFARCLVKTPDASDYLIGKKGCGDTAESAVAQYWDFINGNILVLEPFGGRTRRREIQVF